ncbi:MAG: hypothetical protein ACEQSB_06065, partial [Undibacterium sp.]
MKISHIGIMGLAVGNCGHGDFHFKRRSGKICTSTAAAVRMEVGGMMGSGNPLKRKGSVDQWEQVAALAAATPGVLAVSPVVTGPAFASRGGTS